MRFEIGLSQRAYATRRGVTPKAVRKAIASGRIADAVWPDGTIDAEKADRLWEENTDPTQRRGKEADRAEAAMRARATEAAAAAPDAVDDEEEPVPTPPRGREEFEEDPPRRKPEPIEDALSAHVAANRARATGRPAGDAGDGEDGDDPKMLDLAVEERFEKVRRLRLANDEKERSLVSLRHAELHVFGLLRAISEDWQVWPDVVGPDLAAKYNIDQRALVQDLRDAVTERLQIQASADQVRLDA